MVILGVLGVIGFLLLLWAVVSVLVVGLIAGVMKSIFTGRR